MTEQTQYGDLLRQLHDRTTISINARKYQVK